jgi:hypothetical protein
MLVDKRTTGLLLKVRYLPKDDSSNYARGIKAFLVSVFLPCISIV